VSEIGVGDVLEARCDIAAFGGGPAVVHKGDRATVIAIHDMHRLDHICMLVRRPLGVSLREFPQRTPNAYWCPCRWKKIGGSRADTVRRFAEDLTPAKPKVGA